VTVQEENDQEENGRAHDGEKVALRSHRHPHDERDEHENGVPGVFQDVSKPDQGQRAEQAERRDDAVPE
jgi:hypothetical protein